ncbi:MAG: hypothetical protein KC657_32000 [Myxococcales bacterium]|nr:hypothetical protein [Myxococcales bacterium]
MSRPNPLARHLVAALVFFVCSSFAQSARAERELLDQFHDRWRLVLDQLAGFRVSGSGAAYAGPIGLSFRSATEDPLLAGGTATGGKSTTFWLAPSADLFVAEGLSVGALVELSHTTASLETATGSLDLPSTTSLTVLPRVGYYFPIGDRFGVWPRAGLGYTSSQRVVTTPGAPGQAAAATTDTLSAFVLDVDIGAIYRMNETFYLRLGPQLGLTLGGEHAQSINGAKQSASASALSISAVAGVGVSF